MNSERALKDINTPTPWKIEGLLNMELSEGLKIENENTVIAEICGGIPYGEALGNAAFIVEAVNNHERLVAALEDLIIKANEYRRSHMGEPQLQASIEVAREALRPAKGE